MKNFFYFIWFVILTLGLTPFAFIFLILSIFNYDFFWKKIWNGFIDKLEKYQRYYII